MIGGAARRWRRSAPAIGNASAAVERRRDGRGRTPCGARLASGAHGMSGLVLVIADWLGGLRMRYSGRSTGQARRIRVGASAACHMPLRSTERRQIADIHARCDLRRFRRQQGLLDSLSGRSDVPPFMVMDVMAAAARIEAAGGHVIHMEVGSRQRPRRRRRSRRRARRWRRRGSTIPRRSASRRCAQRIARALSRDLWHARSIAERDRGHHRARPAAFILAFLALFEPGDRVAVAVARLSAVPAHSAPRSAASRC